MSGRRKSKRKSRNTLGKNKIGTRPAEAASTGKSPVDTGMVWPQILPPPLAIPLSLQFAFQVTEWWPQERLVKSQMRQVSALLSHAARTVPYYQEKFSDYPPALLSRMTMDAFQELPLLNRSDIQDAGQALVAKTVPGEHGATFEVRSSGSTGRPITVMGSGLTNIYHRALGMRSHIWHNRDLSAKNVDIRTARTAGQPTRKLRWSVVPDGGECVNLDINLPIDVLLDELIREDPEYLQTHPYTLKGLIENSVERDVRPKRLREVRAFGELLEPAIRDAARKYWNVPVVESYSAMEIGPMAFQCPENENLHVQSESVLLEVLGEDGKPCAPGEVGRVVVTSLHNFATPLVRYEIGDYAEVGEACTCGRGLPVLKRILGRQRNFLVLPSGEKRFPEARKALTEFAPEIRQFQLTQETVEKIVIKLVVTRPFTKLEEDQLAKHLTEKFTHEFEYRFVYVDEIPRSANGKFEEFKSEVV